MKNCPQPKLIFLRVTDNKTKLARITTTVQQHFIKGERILIIAPNEMAVGFLDELLWKIPEDSFIPHATAPCDAAERIIIVKDISENPNRATIIMNLHPVSIKEFDKFETIYELFDQTNAVKEQQSRLKMSEYEKAGLSPGKEQSASGVVKH